MDWQPIETAPKDGRPILTYMPGERGGFVNVQTYRGGEDKWCNAGESKRRRMQQPTHWMPLPSPPEVTP